MNVKINYKILDSLNEDDIIIEISAGQNSEEFQKILNNIQKIAKEKDSIIGYKNSELFIIPINKISAFYSKEQKVFCKAENSEFIVKKRLYELEENLNENQFIRISNSCIVNLKYIECFDLKYIDNIDVKMKNGELYIVSKRRIKHLLKFLKERWN